MSFDCLRVLHLKGHQAQISNSASVLKIGTCQRTLWIYSTEMGAAVRELEAQAAVAPLSGVDAYSFLLRFAAGLESEVVGETDVFGQVKEAVKACEAPWIQNLFQKIFEDTKEVRARYLQDLGGVSYGTLVRKFLRDRGNVQSPTVMIGAGKLATSVGQFFEGQELWIINRSSDRAHALAAELCSQYGVKARVLESADAIEQGLAAAKQLIVCTPVDPERDVAKILAWQKGGRSESRIVLHLGAESMQGAPWAALPQAYFLDDLFEFQKSQGEVRSIQVAQALKACEERAKLRALGGSLSIHHGWEDLAVFA